MLTRGTVLNALTPESFQGGRQRDAVCDLAHALPEVVAAVQQLITQHLNLQGNCACSKPFLPASDCT